MWATGCSRSRTARALDNNMYLIACNVDVEALRRFRASAQWDNWIKDLTTEQYQLIYEQPIYPKNIYLYQVPYTHDEYRREVIAKQIELMHKRDIWVPPER